jgi:hypothetical protein
MNERAVIGGNNPPDPIDQITASYDAMRGEAENWLDGSPVETEDQMKAVDVLRKSMREYRLELEAGQKSSTAPLYDVYKAELARWKPTIEDAQRIENGLIATVDTFKRKLAAEKEAKRKEAERIAWEETRKAQEAARAASTSDIEAQRTAAAAMQAAEDAQKAAKVAAKDTVKGLRPATLYEVTDHRALLHWIATNRRDDLTAFVNEWARKNHKENRGADGLRVWTEQQSF